jgi:hypothetical protein
MVNHDVQMSLRHVLPFVLFKDQPSAYLGCNTLTMRMRSVYALCIFAVGLVSS